MAEFVQLEADQPGENPSNSEETSVLHLPDRMREAVGKNNQSEVARRAGVSTRTLQRYLDGGGGLKLTALVAIADACGVSVEWLITGRGDRQASWVTSRYPGMEPIGTVVEDGTQVARGPSLQLPGGSRKHYAPIPRYNIQASAGFGALAEHAQVVEYLAFDLDFVRNRLRRDPKRLVLIEARGDSMEPTIRDGDILTVDITPDQPLQHAQLYVIRVEHDLMVKRLERRLDGALIVHSDNPRYAPETVPRAGLDQLQILGQVILVSAPPR